MLRSASVVAAASALVACGPAGLVTTPHTMEDASIQGAQVSTDSEPFVVEWQAADRTALEVTSNDGLVVVSYRGRKLELLGACEAAGRYELETAKPNRESVAIASVNELYARLPLNAASLEADLKAGGGLELDYVSTGLRRARPPVDVTGNCEHATHYVRAMTVGAFSLGVRRQERAAIGADVGPLDAGARREVATQTLKKSGDVERCMVEPDGAECQYVLRLTLEPLPEHVASALRARYPEMSDEEEREGPPYLAIAGFGVAGIAAVVGAVTGGIAASDASALAEACPGDVCTPDKQGEIDATRALAHASTVSFAFAGAGVVVGILGLVLGGGAAEPQTAGLRH